jgi:integrase
LEELRLLEEVDVSERVEWQKAKDCFLIGCYTGLRISDIKRLNPVNTKDGLIQMRLLKTNKEVKIPIIKSCDEILKRYGYRSPRFPDQKVNEHIKEVCKKAKINSPIIKPIHRGGEMTTKTYKKYKLITSHVAGKTFITLAPKLWGLTPAEIAHIVGKDLRTLLSSYFNDQSESGRKKMIEMDLQQMKVS